MILLSVVFLFLISFGQTALAKSQLFQGEKYQKLVENGLERLIYNPQGESVDGKAVYIVGGALCPYTQRIMQATDKLKALTDKGIQIRWVFPRDNRFNPAPVRYLAYEPIPQAFDDFFQRIGKESTEEETLLAATNMVLSQTSGALHGYPTITYKTAQGVKYTTSIDDVLAEAEKIVPIGDKTGETREFVKEILEKDLGQPVKVKNNSKKTIHAYALPDRNSPAMGGGDRFLLKPGQPCVDTCYDFNDEFFLCKFEYQDISDNYFYEKN